MGIGLAGQRVVVVGGSSGMGLALSARLLCMGCKVTIVGRSDDKLDAAREQLKSRGIPTLHQADVTSEAQVQQLFEASGPVDHLVCTAADIRGAYELLPSLPLTALVRAIRSKVVAPILLAKHGAPRMPTQGSITLTSGIAAYRPRPKGVAVAAINAALEGVVRAMAVELAPIRVNAVSPGWVRTPIWNDVAGADSETLLASMAGQLPVGRVGTADDIADAVVFLLGNGYTTGAVLHVDGGHRLV
ncbi:SDR family oxidoreductase [Achromobacter piechaudii]|uniref:Glucose 1-dehydrogenase n=1 Tax=Achromobacter piechaudii TaxID=72556 RepID=A0A6S7CRP7_9BURK|nr:SDR family oxidoreductase [Achromobacter piechaudii]CAB3862210.1 Glucose 1-dehydrogenase [Achromobacter piechaudii]